MEVITVLRAYASKSTNSFQGVLHRGNSIGGLSDIVRAHMITGRTRSWHVAFRRNVLRTEEIRDIFLHRVYADSMNSIHLTVQRYLSSILKLCLPADTAPAPTYLPSLVDYQ
jgi:hypothetical protein